MAGSLVDGSRELLILGASTRAAAFSALRAGWRPRCVDEYGDRDLAAVAKVRTAAGSARVEAFESLAAECPGGSWFYTGPLENEPDLVERLARVRRLLGNPAEVLRAVRDPFRVAALLRRQGLAHPEVLPGDANVARDGSWLVKPLASGGGRCIEPLVAGLAARSAPCYLQRFLAGTSGSAVFLASRDGARLLGATWQLHGGPAGRFAYRGSIGPIELGHGVAARLGRVGDALARGFGLAGLFGVDFILCEGEPWPVEVNPRYTASVEVLERALRRSLLREHFSVFEETARQVPHPPVLVPPRRPPRVAAKAVLYATRPFETSDVQPLQKDHPTIDGSLDVADIPWPGTRLNRGEPILTVLAEGPDEATCLARLKQAASRWRARIEGQDFRDG